MKLSAFVLGGIAGAATVMLLRKQSFASVAGGMSRMMKTWGGESDRNSKGKALSLMFGSGSHSSAANSGQSGEKTQSTGEEGAGIEKIARMASEDESVKNEINEILEQNEQPQI